MLADGVSNPEMYGRCGMPKRGKDMGCVSRSRLSKILYLKYFSREDA